MWKSVVVFAVIMRIGYGKSSYLRFLQDEHFCPKHLHYLVTIRCQSGIQCAVGCLNTLECMTVDVKSGALYKPIEDSSRTQDLNTRSESCSISTLIIFKGDAYLSRKKDAEIRKNSKVMKKRENILYLNFQNTKDFLLFYPESSNFSGVFSLMDKPQKIAFFTKTSVIVAVNTSIVRYNLSNGSTNNLVASVVTQDLQEGEEEGVVYVYGKAKNDKICLWRISFPTMITYTCSVPKNAKMILYAKAKFIYFVSKTETVAMSFQGDISNRFARGLDSNLITLEKASETLYFIKRNWIMTTDLRTGGKDSPVTELSKNVSSFAFCSNTFYFSVNCENAKTSYPEYCFDSISINSSKMETIKRFANPFYVN